MAIGTGVIRGSEIRAEVGGSVPYRLNSAAVRSLAEAASTGAFRLSALRGKSAITLSIGTVNGFGGSGSFRYTTITANISKTGGGPITAYNWVIESDIAGGLSFTSARNVATAAFQGPAYETKGFNTNATASIGCTVTVDGTNYYRSAEVYYRVGAPA